MSNLSVETPQFYSELGLHWFKPYELGFTLHDNNQEYPVSVGYSVNPDGSESKRLINFAGMTVTDRLMRPSIPVDMLDRSIIFSSLSTQLYNPSFLYHEVATAAALISLHLTGETVADFGAGCGIQSFIALKRGAEKAILIEQDRQQMSIARNSIALNGSNPAQGILVQEDIANLERPEYKPAIAMATVAVVNIGPHEIYEGETGVQLDVWRKIKTIGHGIKAVVLGGFADDEKLKPDFITSKYAELGFQEVNRAMIQEVGRQLAVVLSRE